MTQLKLAETIVKTYTERAEATGNWENTPCPVCAYSVGPIRFQHTFGTIECVEGVRQWLIEKNKHHLDKNQPEN